MPFRNQTWILALFGLLALSGCTQLNLHSGLFGAGKDVGQSLNDPDQRERYLSEQSEDIRRKAQDTVVRRIRSMGAEKCLTAIEADLMVADFMRSLDADIDGLKKASRNCCRPGAREDVGVIVGRVKDLDAHVARYQNPATETSIFSLINTYGAQASAPRQSEICQTRMKKIAEFAAKQLAKTGASPAPGKTGDPAGIEVLVPEFEKRIGTLGLYRNLIGPVAPSSP